MCKYSLNTGRYRPNLPLLACIVLLQIVAFSSCRRLELSGGHSSSPATDNAALRQLAKKRGVSGPPDQGRSLPHISDPLPQLGRLLFSSRTLSNTGTTACVTCHHPQLGGGDGLSLPRGVDVVNPDVLGPGRKLKYEHQEGPIIPRNAPTTFNVGMFDSAMFWDGRLESLGKEPLLNGAGPSGIRTPDTRFETLDPEAGPNLLAALSVFPLSSEEEMFGLSSRTEKARNETVREMTVARLRSEDEWIKRFETAFGSADEDKQMISVSRLRLALGEFQRSQVFTSNPWFRFLAGADRAISERAKRGARLFYLPVSQGGASCYACHRGSFFTDERFHVLGVPQIGRGKADGDSANFDHGRYRESRREVDRFAFRTPPLLNVEVTGPYGRTGAYTSLAGIIRHHLNIPLAIESYDGSQLEGSVRVPDQKDYAAEIARALQIRREAGMYVAREFSLSEDQIGDLVEFLRTLTDPCVKDASCLKPWTVVAEEEDPTGALRLLAVKIADNSRIEVAP